uniref:Mitochondrial carnitine/acylcarnitine carrier protein n=1 Tax=Solanum tuberosum TaxID=4113 RepID=M0ZM75_SOLTU
MGVNCEWALQNDFPAKPERQTNTSFYTVLLDKTRFYVVGAGIFTGLTVALYPISVIKTRMQVATNNAANESAFSVVRGLVRNDGIPGLYRGFGTVITGAVPARIIFLTALETTKVTAFKMVEPFKLSEPVQAAIANGVAGMLASLCSQSVFVPIDIVSQRLMVQGYSGHASYNGGLDVARKVLKSEGIRGLYRGFSLSVLTYSPSSAVWWASYGSSQRFIWSKLLDNGTEHGGPAPSQGKIVSVQAAGGIIAGATASCITTPLDTIKTRLQAYAARTLQKCRWVRVGSSKSSGFLDDPARVRQHYRECEQHTTYNYTMNFGSCSLLDGLGVLFGLFKNAIGFVSDPPKVVDFWMIRQECVMGHDKRPTARQVVKQLIAEDGWTGFYRGLGPRFVSMSAWGTSMILAYEYLMSRYKEDEGRILE